MRHLSLPLLALTLRVLPPFRMIAFGLVSCSAVLIVWHPTLLLLTPFLGGIAASLLARFDGFRSFASTSLSSYLALACIVAAVVIYPSAFTYGAIVLLAAAFSLIANGTDMFGVLTLPVSRAFGELGYSIYLLHGVILYIAFNFVIGAADARTFPAAIHWLVIVGITPFLILLCFASFRFIERPSMRKTPAFMNWIRSI